MCSLHSFSLQFFGSGRACIINWCHSSRRDGYLIEVHLFHLVWAKLLKIFYLLVDYTNYEQLRR
jgi:hypothetical protein